MADNAAGIVAIELLAAAQGVEFETEFATSDVLAGAIAVVREVAPFYHQDRPFAPDVAALKRLIAAGRFNAFPGANLLPSLA